MKWKNEETNEWKNERMKICEENALHWKYIFENGNKIELINHRRNYQSPWIAFSSFCAECFTFIYLVFDVTKDVQATFTQQLAVLNSSSNCTKVLFTRTVFNTWNVVLKFRCITSA